MAISAENSLFDHQVGDFDWGPRRRWRTRFATAAPNLLAVLGVLLLIAALM